MKTVKRSKPNGRDAANLKEGNPPLECAGIRINVDASKNTRGVEILITQDEMVWDVKRCELVSWVVAMSLGFIIQVRVRPHALSRLNRFMELKT